MPAYGERHQELAIAALASGLTQRQAADAASVNPKTVTRWLADPAFNASIAEAQSSVVAAARRRLVSITTAAVERLASLLECGDPKIELQSAVKILELAGVSHQPAPGNDNMPAIWVQRESQVIAIMQARPALEASISDSIGGALKLHDAATDAESSD